MSNETLFKAVNEASERWKSSFNSGNAAGCANEYEETAVMNARPFGIFTGREAIQRFWQNLIDDGFSDVDYIEPKIRIVDENSAILTSKWKMNKAGGVIHKELWVFQADGTVKLREDDFEAQN
ncbi:MAG: isochorismatase [Cyanobacteria bacterium P01_E01_bin.42]